MDPVIYHLEQDQIEDVVVKMVPGSPVYIDPPRAIDLSSNGQYVALDSEASTLVSGDQNGWRDVFLYDVGKGRMTCVSQEVDGQEANGESDQPALDSSGRFVAFASHARKLVPVDTNTVRDAFLWYEIVMDSSAYLPHIQSQRTLP